MTAPTREQINEKIALMAERLGQLADLFEERGMPQEGVDVLRQVQRDCLEFKGPLGSPEQLDFEIKYMRLVLETLRKVRRIQKGEADQ